MIRPLRQCHRGAFVLLSIALPALVILAFRARTASAQIEALPAGLLRAERPFESSGNHADVLLYWSPQSAAVGESLPSKSLLLGTVRNQSTTATALLPDGGYLLEYSLATGEVQSSRSQDEEPVQ